MPHLILEYSDNLVKPLDHRALFGELHATLDAFGEFKLDQMKSRAMARDMYFVGAGAPENIFVHLTLYILGGRALELRQQISHALLGTLSRALEPNVRGRPSDLTVDVREMTRETYAKAQTAE
jgi:5-carboxymethyl-2-hydroxymuconate isomerase